MILLTFLTSVAGAAMFAAIRRERPRHGAVAVDSAEPAVTSRRDGHLVHLVKHAVQLVTSGPRRVTTGQGVGRVAVHVGHRRDGLRRRQTVCARERGRGSGLGHLTPVYIGLCVLATRLIMLHVKIHE